MPFANWTSWVNYMAFISILSYNFTFHTINYFCSLKLRKEQFVFISTCTLRYKHTLYRVKTSVVSLVASYHERRFTTWVISVLSSGRTKCFFPSEVCRRILAKEGTTSLDKLTFNNTTPFTVTWMTQNKHNNLIRCEMHIKHKNITLNINN